jgi:hypothetical protein
MKQHDSIMVVVDKLTDPTHFILVKMIHKETHIAKIYMKEVARLHGVPKKIVSDRDTKFTYNFWKVVFKVFGTNLNISTIYHPKSDGKTERTSRIIEDMLQLYVMDQPSKWEYYIHLVEFLYTNGYQASLKMSPFESLYGIKYYTPVSLDNPVDREVVGQDLLKEMEKKMKNIKKNLEIVKNRKKSYAEKNRVFRDFKVGEHVFLKVKEKISSLRLGICPKLIEKYCGPFEILEKIGPVSYVLALLASMRAHIVFHVLLLKKYVPDPNHIIDWDVI